MATKGLKLEDNICPICLYIFIQPVTMPCGHELCLTCFKQNVEEANFCCPMCRTRISTWARRASRTNSLVNQKRWDEIQLLFPDQVQNRLEGLEEDDEEMKALNVSIKLSEPGEIRSEYEEQLKKLQAQRAEERRREQEASMKLILELQAEEQKKQQELEQIERQDEELAKVLSQNASPLEHRTRSALSTRSVEDSMEATNMEEFLNKMRKEDKSPYPYPCLSPNPSGEGKLCVDRDKLKVIEESFRRQKVKKDKNLITTQDIANMEEQFRMNRPKAIGTDGIEIDCLRKATGSSTSLTATMTKSTSSSTLNQQEILNQMSEDLDATLKSVDNSEDPDIIVIPSRASSRLSSVSNPKTDCHRSSRQSSNNKEERSASVSSSTHSPSNSHRSSKQKSKDEEGRSASAQSTDSISVELSHFRPIRSCPLTPPRVLPGGKVVEPQLIRTTPRNLGKMGLGSPMETNLSDIDAGSPIMKRRLSELAEERKDQVVRLSKSTSMDDDENRNPDSPSSIMAWAGQRSTNTTRGEEFRDISNSPCQKRKFDFNAEELDQSPAKKKMILSLEPDLDDSDGMIPDPTEMIKVLPKVSDIGRVDERKVKKQSRLTKAHNAKSSRVQYTVDSTSVSSPQSSITQWVKKGEAHMCVDNNALNGFISASRDEVDGMMIGNKNHKKDKLRMNKSKVVGAMDKFLTQDSLVSSRPQRKRKTLRHSDYVYAVDTKKGDAESENGSESEFVAHTPIKRGRHSLNSETDSSFENCEPEDIGSLDGSFISITPQKKDSSNASRSSRHKLDSSNKMCEDLQKLSFSKSPKSQHRRVIKDKSKVKCKSSRTMLDYLSPKNSADRTRAAKELVETDMPSLLDQEERDRLFAIELQKQFELEAKLHIDAPRFKGTKDEYSLRKKPKVL